MNTSNLTKYKPKDFAKLLGVLMKKHYTNWIEKEP